MLEIATKNKFKKAGDVSPHAGEIPVKLVPNIQCSPCLLFFRKINVPCSIFETNVQCSMLIVRTCSHYSLLKPFKDEFRAKRPKGSFAADESFAANEADETSYADILEEEAEASEYEEIPKNSKLIEPTDSSDTDSSDSFIFRSNSKL